MSAKTNASEERYTFFVEWFDKPADLIRRYQLTYFLRDETVEMYDIKNKRPFLKRGPYGKLRAEDLYIGAVINVHSRQLNVKEYADVYTRKMLDGVSSRTLGLIKPDVYRRIGEIISEVHDMRFVISKMRMVKMTRADVEEFYAEQKGTPHFNELVEYMTSDVVVAMELVGERGIPAWLEKIGATEETDGKPDTLRARFGTNHLKNAVHGSRSITEARNELAFFFDRKFPTTALFNNCTCAVIRPHAVERAGEILDIILAENFEISAMQLMNLSTEAAEEFLDVYKGVLPEYHDSVKQMASGPVIVLEVRQENAVETFRALVGPHDPEIARHLRPNTLRGRFGVDRVKNALHCSDLPEDGLLEVEYFFNILANA